MSPHRIKRPRRTALAIAAAATLLVGAAALGSGLWIEAKAVVGQVMLQKAWTETLKGNEPAKPWSWADTWPVARVEAPAQNKSAIVLKGASGEAMAWGPGLMDGTPTPGDSGTAIIAAHRDTHFAFLKDVAPGEEIDVTNADGTRHRFRVTETRIVRWNASGIDPAEGEGRLALVTCYPFDAKTSGPLRYVVLADLVPPARYELEQMAQASPQTSPEAGMTR